MSENEKEMEIKIEKNCDGSTKRAVTASKCVYRTKEWIGPKVNPSDDRAREQTEIKRGEGSGYGCFPHKQRSVSTKQPTSSAKEKKSRRFRAGINSREHRIMCAYAPNQGSFLSPSL